MRARAGIPLLTGTGVLAVLISMLALRARPMTVDIALAHLAPLEVTEEDQAETRSHDRYVVAAPVTGRLLRVLLRDGDPVRAGEAVARMAAAPLTRREQLEATAQLEAALAAENATRAGWRHTLEDLAQARREEARLTALLAQGLSSTQALEQARTAVSTLGMDVTAARDRVRSAAAQVRGARAALEALREAAGDGGTLLTLRAPITGRVLRVLEPSERVIAFGTPVMTLGDLSHLEVVMEMLSSQAVRVSPGMPAQILGWGSERSLRARVRRVEPFAFTKVSALGVEEKRAYVILDFIDPPGPLGDGYRVIARITTWSAPAVLQIPLGALFRRDRDWCVFVVRGGRAHLRPVQIGHESDEAVEIRRGLRAGDQVIVHPPNALTAGARVRVAP